MEIPAIVTVLFVPTVFVAKVAVAELVDNVMLSLPCTPTSVADPKISCAVAAVVESYTRLLAVMPETVSSFVVMFAVAEGCVNT